MLDPIGGFERIRDLYVAYLDTAFRVRRQSLLKRRRELLRTPGTLTTLPLIGLSPATSLPKRHLRTSWKTARTTQSVALPGQQKWRLPNSPYRDCFPGFLPRESLPASTGSSLIATK